MEDPDFSLNVYHYENIKLKRRNKIYQEVAEHYANPLTPWDGGEFARRAILNVSNPNYRFSRIKDFMCSPLFSSGIAIGENNEEDDGE